jgi:hypothetical protein
LPADVKKLNFNFKMQIGYEEDKIIKILENRRSIQSNAVSEMIMFEPSKCKDLDNEVMDKIE